MARFLRFCTWLLVLGPGLLATVRAECSQDCATCSYRLVRPADINFLVSVERGELNFPQCFLCSCCSFLLFF
uniref:Proenkephalin-A n=1 Tax=Microcebus murinus TaxID=30608 RepID=A0A8C5XMU5_MICMU